MGVRNDEVVLIVDIEDYFGSIQVLHGHVLEGEVEGLLPDRIVGLSADLSGAKITGVFFVWPRISTSTKASHADLSRVVR